MTRGITAADERLVRAAVARMRAGVMALVFAMVGGAGLFVATAWLLLQGGENVGQTLGLLHNYFPGYSVTWTGALVGLAWGALTGAVAGWVLARVYNRIAERNERRERET